MAVFPKKADVNQLVVRRIRDARYRPVGSQRIAVKFEPGLPDRDAWCEQGEAGHSRLGGKLVRLSSTVSVQLSSLS